MYNVTLSHHYLIYFMILWSFLFKKKKCEKVNTVFETVSCFVTNKSLNIERNCVFAFTEAK